LTCPDRQAGSHAAKDTGEDDALGSKDAIQHLDKGGNLCRPAGAHHSVNLVHRESRLCHGIHQALLDVLCFSADQVLKLGPGNGLPDVQVLSSKVDQGELFFREGNLARLNLLQYFDVVHTSDDVERTKPDPALYWLALRSLGLSPVEAIVLEDSPNGVNAAKDAGIFTVAIPNRLTASLNLDRADLRLESLADYSLGDIIRAAEKSNGFDQ